MGTRDPRSPLWDVSRGEPEADEAAEVRWFSLDDALAMISSGEILGAMTVIGVQHALLRRAASRVPPE